MISKILNIVNTDKKVRGLKLMIYRAIKIYNQSTDTDNLTKHLNPIMT